MSLVKKVMTEATAMQEAQVKKESTISKAAKLFHESGLASRCPALAKMYESTNQNDKYKAAVMTTILENTNKLVQEKYQMPGLNLFKEDVTSSTAALMPGVASLTPRVVDIVNIFYPRMVAHYLADIQAIDRQTGEIFVIKTRYGMTAAGVAAGDIIFEKPTDGSYASEWLSYAEKDVEAANTLSVTADTSFAPNPAEIPSDGYLVRAGSVRVYLGGKEIARDYGTGQIAGKGVLNTSVIDYATGEITLNLDAAVYQEAIDNQVKLSAQAARDTEINDDTIRTIEFDVLNQPVRAEEHPLMSSYSVASALVANAHMALDVDALISNQLAGTIKWERDLALIRKISRSALGNTHLDFDCQANGQNLTLKQRYNAFDVFVSTARGLIQEAMGRGTVEYIIVSATQGLTIVEQIDGFVASPEGKKPVGPYLAGTLRDGTVSVIAIPYTTGANAPMMEDEVIFGFKGFQTGDAAVIVAEWVPLYFTPTFQAPNLKNHKGCLSFYDMFVNQPKYLVKGAIQHFNEA